MSEAFAEPVSADEARLRSVEWDIDEDAFLAVLDETVAAMDEAEIPYVLMGGIASATVGRPRWTHDIDLFVTPHDARRVLQALEAKGFGTEETYADWLYKAFKGEQLVDIIFKSTGDVYLDEEMLERACHRPFKGREVRVIPSEDLIVIKALVHNEHMPRHWHDALALIANNDDLDWDYLLKRARKGARRVLSLLLYAQSNDLVVPTSAVRELFALIEGDIEIVGITK